MAINNTQIAVPGSPSPVSLLIKDASNIVVSSGELTGIVVGAIIRAAAEIVVQGIVSITLTIDRIGAQIEYVTYQGQITRKLTKFEMTVAMYSAAKRQAQNSSYDAAFVQEWLKRIEESFYKDMAALS